MSLCNMQILKPLEVEKRTRINIYITMAFQTLFCGCENWAVISTSQNYIRRNEIDENRKVHLDGQ
jgi:hypothetical protein